MMLGGVKICFESSVNARDKDDGEDPAKLYLGQ